MLILSRPGIAARRDRIVRRVSGDEISDVAFNSLMDGIFRLERSIMRIGTLRLARWGMTLSAYTAMRVLDGQPDLSLAQLSRRCYVQPQTMTRIISSLTERGYVARSRSSHSERAIALRLTDEGVAALREMDVEVLQIKDSFTSALTVEQLGQLTEHLRAAARGVEGDLREILQVAKTSGTAM